MMIYDTKKLCSNEEENETPIAGTPMSIIGEDILGDKSNNIFLYETINEQSVLKVRTSIDKKVVAHRTFLVDNDLDVKSIQSDLHINLYINSYGGSASDAFNLHDYIKRCSIPIYTYVEGIAASAAMLISVAGKKRFMTPNSLLMIQQLSTWFGTSCEDFKDGKSNFDSFITIIKKIYTQNTKLSMEKIDDLLERDTYLNAEECLGYGFVDEIC